MTRRWLVLIVGLAALLRLNGITSTPTDWHAFRQADTASVTREYVKHGIDLLRPKYQDLSNIQSGKDNLDGYRMVEFPIVNGLLAWILRAVPSLDLVVTSRVFSLLCSLGVVLCIYELGKSWQNRAVGYWSALVFAILPYARYYSRAILPEIPLLLFLTSSLVFFDWWLVKRRWYWYFLSLLMLILALLLKPFVAFFGLVWLVRVIQVDKKFKWQRWLALIIYGGVAVIPLYFWRKWILNFPTGIPASDWLFNSDHIRFRPAWWRWLFWERLTKLLLGFFGVPLAVIGMLKRGKAWWSMTAWWLGVLIYFIVLATGNVRHDYYQILVLPILSLTLGVGIVSFLDWSIPHTTRSLRLVIVGILLAGMVTVGWSYIGPYYGTRPDWEVAGQAADQLLPADAKVIAPAFGDTAFLFQTNRIGWPIGFEIDKKIALGAQYYVTTSDDDEAKQLQKQFQVMAKTSDYIIINLLQPVPPTPTK